MEMYRKDEYKNKVGRKRVREGLGKGEGKGKWMLRGNGGKGKTRGNENGQGRDWRGKGRQEYTEKKGKERGWRKGKIEEKGR